MRRKHHLEGLEELEQRLLLRSHLDAPPLGLPPPRGAPNTVYVDPNQFDPMTSGLRLRNAIFNAQSNQTIVVMPGYYEMVQSLYIGFSSQVQNLTIRGFGEDFNQVLIRGYGMDDPNFGTVPHGFSINNAQNVTIANLSIGNVWHHPIDMQGVLGADNIRLYHVRLFDAGEQFIKANPGGGGVDNVTIEYCLIEYTVAPPVLDHSGLGTGYTNGISSFEADNWVVRYNTWRNFHTPDSSNFWYNPAILMRVNSSNNIIEGNTFINVDRAIFFGLADTDPPNHFGGIIRNNFIWQDPNLFSPARRGNADAMIGIYDSPDTKVYHNTIMTHGNHPRSIEVRWVNPGVELRNNLTDTPFGVRDGGSYTESGNYTAATTSMFVNPSAGDLHLLVNASTQANVIDRVPVLTGSVKDWDGGTRTVNLADIGADEITPTPLFITSAITLTTSGIALTFNQPVFTPVLNLYDQGGMLGAPDVTLVGATLGNVPGSVTFNADHTVLTFLRTGGILLPDVYTFTLRSASDGFRTSQNQYLDGNRDHGYVHTFTVLPLPSNAVTVGISDFARGPGQAVNVPTTAPGLRLTLTNPQQAQSLAFILLWDATLLTITDFQLAPGISGTSSYTEAGPGNASLQIFGSGPFTTGPGPLVLGHFVASVPATAPYGSKHVVDISGPFVFGATGQLPAVDDDALHVTAYLGDVTGNARLSSADAAGVLKVGVGLDSGFAAYQMLDPVVVADIDGNGRLGSLDANRVLQEALGFDRPEIPPLPATPPTIVFGGPDPLLHFPTDFLALPGETVRVPLLLDPSDGLETADLIISYDPTRLEVVSESDVQRGDLTEDFDLFGVNLDQEAGTIRVGLARTAGPISGRGKGSVLMISFRIWKDAPPGSTIINLRHGIGHAATQLNEGGLDLIPDPSNEEGDELDGAILIHKPIATRLARDQVFAQATEAGRALRTEMVNEYFRTVVLAGGLARKRRSG